MAAPSSYPRMSLKPAPSKKMPAKLVQGGGGNVYSVAKGYGKPVNLGGAIASRRASKY